MNLEKLSTIYSNYLLENNFTGNPTNLYEAMDYIMKLGGKRIRPIFTLASANLFTDHITEVLPIAHAIEVFHNFTLVHDDIMDDANTRRGKETVHTKYSIPTAILTGDNMLIASMLLLNNCDKRIRENVLQTAMEVCEGQQMDMNFEKLVSITEVDYLEMIKLKTAVLIGCSCYCGAASAGETEAICKIMYNYGVEIGLAFQMQDDWLDTFGNTASTGKQIGGDIMASKKMWLYILAKKESDKIDEIYAITNTEERVKEATAYFNNIGINEKLLSLQELHYTNATNLLNEINVPESRKLAFKEIEKMLTSRES